jgi:hypothetical protein
MIFFPTTDEDFQYFRAQGYAGSIDDMHYAALGDLGYTGNITDRTYAYLIATYGSYHEAMRDLRNGTSVFALVVELITNGTFDADTTGWAGTSATLSAVGGRIRVTITGSYGSARQSFATEIGRTYSYSVERYGGTANAHGLRFGTTSGGTEYYASSATPDVVTTGTFVATTTVAHITLYGWTTTVGAYSEYDNVSVQVV